MIANDQQLQLAQAAVENLQRVLLAARKVHSPHEYRLMSAPILLELQQREQGDPGLPESYRDGSSTRLGNGARQHLTRHWSRQDKPETLGVSRIS
jgi:hypothetical protein